MTDTEKKTPGKKCVAGRILRVVMIAAVILAAGFALAEGLYSGGIKAYDSCDYDRAVKLLTPLMGYKDSEEYLEQAELGVHYTNAGIKAEAGEYDEAIREYEEAQNFRNAKELLKETYDLKGEELYRKKEYVEAAEAFISAGNQNRALECGITLIVDMKNYSSALTALKSNTLPNANAYSSYADGMLKLKNRDYQAAKDSFARCSGLLDADERKNESMFLLAEEALHEGYLNKAQTLYKELPKDYIHNDVKASDRVALLKKNAKLVNMVGSWSATDTYFKVQADSTTSSYYYYWYQDELNLGTVKVVCPYNDDGTFTVQGTATYPTYTNFSSRSSELEMDLRTFTFSKTCKNSVPYQIDASSTTKLTYNGRQFALDYKFVNDYSNVYWHYTFTSKVKYGTRNMLPEDC